MHQNGRHGTHRVLVFSDETEYPEHLNPGSTTGRPSRKLSHLTNPSGVAAVPRGGVGGDRGLAPRCSDADGCSCFVARKKWDFLRCPGEGSARAELGRTMNLAATAATQS